MSNEGKWDKRLVELLPQRAADKINQLQQEKEELRERLNTIKAELNEVRECYQYSQAANKMTPRTDADGLSVDELPGFLVWIAERFTYDITVEDEILHNGEIISGYSILHQFRTT